MLLPGHLAGGYLATLSLLKLAHPHLDPEQIKQLLIIGTVAGAIPDWDHLISFIQIKHIQLPSEDKQSHRNLFTHTPIFWLLISLVVCLLTKNSSFGPYLALTIWIGSWSHFVLDTLIHGIRWLWPLTNRKFALFNLNVRPDYTEPSFWPYWWKFLKWYTQFICFYLEIGITLLALVIFIFR